jgi:hypothetical protein
MLTLSSFMHGADNRAEVGDLLRGETIRRDKRPYLTSWGVSRRLTKYSLVGSSVPCFPTIQVLMSRLDMVVGR